MDTWINILIISICVWNVLIHMVSVVLYGLIYFLFFKISFRWISIIIDIFSIVYFYFQNYCNIDGVFTSDNIVAFLFLVKKYESDGAFTDRSIVVSLPPPLACFP